MSTKQGPAMSKMSELAMDIEYLLKEGKSLAEIARELEIPVHFVVEAQTLSDADSAECSPFATINS
jgi:predicted transposase YdaD